MKPRSLIPHPQEIELKLALPTSDVARLAKQLARIPVLARRTASQQHLHNVYYDTAEQLLHQQRIALRIRRVGSEAQPQWLQTLKTGGSSHSALSQRGEWETAVPGNALALDALKATPWSALDPVGAIFQSLAPCFTTRFERTSWSVRRRDGSLIEVALDIGHIAAGGKSAPLCELELELRAGQPAALFDLAQQIARSIAVLPLSLSKAERGYALAQERLDMPLGAQPPKLTDDLSLSGAAGRVLGEMFGQFTTNLNALYRCDNPEVLHQARVGWRRFKSGLRLFKSGLTAGAIPSFEALQPLLELMGELRDLDVAGTDTLPPLADVYTAGDTRRVAAWQAMTRELRQAATLQRKSVRYALQAPAVGAALLAITQWLEGLSALPGPGGASVGRKESLRRWARHRIVRLHKQLKAASRDTGNPDSQHRARILAKRVRYGIEALRTLLPKKRRQRWHQQATSQQAQLGTARDVMRASALAAQLDADGLLVAFLRGIAVGQSRMGPHSGA
jgi:inorganic triphosphatase YgiF